MNDKPPLPFLLHNLKTLVACIELHHGTGHLPFLYSDLFDVPDFYEEEE